MTNVRVPKKRSSDRSHHKHRCNEKPCGISAAHPHQASHKLVGVQLQAGDYMATRRSFLVLQSSAHDARHIADSIMESRRITISAFDVEAVHYDGIHAPIEETESMVINRRDVAIFGTLKPLRSSRVQLAD